MHRLFLPLKLGPRTTIRNRSFMPSAGISPIEAVLNFFGMEAPKSGIALMIANIYHSIYIALYKNKDELWFLIPSTNIRINPGFYLSLDASGYLTYEYAQTLYLDKNDYRLSYISGITPGTATAGVALMVGNDLSLIGLGAVSCTSLTINGVAVGTLPSFINDITPGTAANGKALVLSETGTITGISSLSATSISGTLQTDRSLILRLLVL